MVVVFKHVSLLERQKKPEQLWCQHCGAETGLELILLPITHLTPAALVRTKNALKKDSNLDVQLFKRERK